jgi:hypothetical protein
MQVTGGDARLEDEVLVSFGDATTVVDDNEGAIAASAQGGGYIDVAGAGVARVAQEFEESGFDRAQASWAASETLRTRQASEAGTEISVRTFQRFLR